MARHTKRQNNTLHNKVNQLKQAQKRHRCQKKQTMTLRVTLDLKSYSVLCSILSKATRRHFSKSHLKLLGEKTTMFEKKSWLIGLITELNILENKILMNLRN